MLSAKKTKKTISTFLIPLNCFSFTLTLKGISVKINKSARSPCCKERFPIRKKPGASLK